MNHNYTLVTIDHDHPISIITFTICMSIHRYPSLSIQFLTIINGFSIGFSKHSAKKSPGQIGQRLALLPEGLTKIAVVNGWLFPQL